MLIVTQLKLGAVFADREGWADQVREYVDAGTNFLLVLPKDPEEVKKFCHLFEQAEDCQPRTLTQPDFFLLGPFIEPDVFDQVLEHWDNEHQIVFVEQIDFAMNRPPRLKPFLVYCPVLGIIAQCDNLIIAQEELESHQDTNLTSPGNPEAGIYSWRKGRWFLLES